MKIFKEKKCENCGSIFTPRSPRQKFCLPVCRMENWKGGHKGYFRKKYREHRQAKFDLVWGCEKCGAYNKIHYDPKENLGKWKKEKCKECGVKRLDNKS